MKTQKLKDILGNDELSLDEKAAQILAMNGNDVNTAKERVTELESELETLKSKNTELETKVNGFKDYEELVKFKADTLAAKENDQKKEYLTKLGFKRPDLFFEKVDWSKAKYDEDKKEYSGVDVDGLKKTYSELFTDPKPQNKINFGNVGNGKQEPQTTNTSMNNFIRGL